MKNLDTRVQYTKAALHRALLEILKEKPIGKVTIKELVDRAGLNRGTFYLHYSQPQEVLDEIEAQFTAEHLTSFGRAFDGSQDYSAMNQIFATIAENREICRVLLGENGDPQFLRSFVDLCRDDVLNQWQRESPGLEREKLEFIFDYVFTGSTRLILDWIDDDKGLSAEQFGQWLERLGHYSQVAAGEFV